MSDPIASRRIRILREDVSNRIAAGEVIDRPLSVVRELLDNALDAGARSVDVWIERGGLDEVRVVDDGGGMDAADLELCYLPHATSKIASVEDLRSAKTLGFRGEALSSIGLCATLEVVSSRADARAACRLVVRDGRPLSLGPTSGTPGTMVRVTGLFEHQPGRREFLRSPASESAQCAQAFLDKAVAFPGVSFRLFSDGRLRYFLPAASPAERVGGAYPAIHGPGLETRVLETGGHTLAAVLARPELSRRDRKLIQVFVNGRRIWEYALVQAVEYGFAGALPGGLHPVAFLFVTIEPQLVDFNVHPAKREARFRDLPSLHRAVVGLVRSYVLERSVGAEPSGAPAAPSGAPPAPGSAPQRPAGDLELVDGEGSASGRPAIGQRGEVRDVPSPAYHAPSRLECLGQLFGLFLVVEHAEQLYLIDQHAAHERIIFDRLVRDAPAIQELLLPISFDAAAAELRHIREYGSELRQAGVVVEASAGGTCEIVAMDTGLGRIPEEEVIGIVCGRSGDPGGLRRAFCAAAACAAAVRDGEPLDSVTARELAAGALDLPEARCPHGRPVWHRISRTELCRLVKRQL